MLIEDRLGRKLSLTEKTDEFVPVCELYVVRCVYGTGVWFLFTVAATTIGGHDGLKENSDTSIG